MTVEVLAPAKINLGLEVLRKRDDGFHDIATVFQTISLFDHLRISRAEEDSVQIVNSIEQIDGNLVARALELARNRKFTEHHWHVALTKRIPVASGLGGASADAAGTLLAIGGNSEPPELATLALELGSDVPFLLRGGAALAGGRGEKLELLPSLTRCWLVLATPSIELEHKTAQLFGALAPVDFSSGTRVHSVATALQQFRVPDSADLVNAFERPLLTLLPEVSQVREAMLRAGAPFVALSGAGPTHFTIVPELSSAIRIGAKLQHDAPVALRTMVARPASSCPVIRVEKTIESAETL